MRAPLSLTLALLTVLAGTSSSPAQEAVDKAQVAAYDIRMFAGPPGKRAYACFVRRYDAEHLARHPKQKVSEMKLLVSAEVPPDDEALERSFRLGFKYRHRPGNFDSSGHCGPVFGEDGKRELRFACSVDCDGGGMEVALKDDNRSVLMQVERISVWLHNNPDREAGESLLAGADDKIFRLERVDNRECASLVTNRKELAAMRTKRP
jgi:hypothetical protein